MDEQGVDVAVRTNCYGAMHTSVELAEARETPDLLNAEYARPQCQQLDRLRALAMSPLKDTPAALETLGRAVTDLGLAGVHQHRLGGALARDAGTPPRLQAHRRPRHPDRPAPFKPFTRFSDCQGRR
jgi:predicted TIM-barrel fold metal-dependent hydrolase